MLQDKQSIKEQFLNQLKQEFQNDYLAVVIPESISRTFVTYCSMKSDLELALQSLAELQNQNSLILKSSLTISTINLYAKCFTQPAQNQVPKLERNIFQNDNRMMEVHDWIMELRHLFIAHRSESMEEYGIALLLLKKPQFDSQRLMFHRYKRLEFSKEEIELFKPLVESALKHIVIKLKSIQDRLVERFLKENTLDQLKLISLNTE